MALGVKLLGREMKGESRLGIISLSKISHYLTVDTNSYSISPETQHSSILMVRVCVCVCVCVCACVCVCTQVQG